MNAQLFNDPMMLGVDPVRAAVATHLHPPQLHPAPVGSKAVDLDFAGGRLSSDAGVVLLKDIDEQLGLTRAQAAMLSDWRDACLIHLPPEDWLKQRVWQFENGVSRTELYRIAGVLLEQLISPYDQSAGPTPC